MGAGLLLTKTDAATLQSAVDTVLTDERYRQNAALIRRSFRRCTGAKGAADKILDVLKK